MCNALIKLETTLAFGLRAVVVICMLLIFGFTIGSALERYIIQTSFHAHAEVAGIALVWATFAGFMLAYRERANICVDLIDAWLSPQLLQVRRIFEDVVALVVFVAILTRIGRLIEVGSTQTVLGTAITLDVIYSALLAMSVYGLLLISIRIYRLVIGSDYVPE